MPATGSSTSSSFGSCASSMPISSHCFCPCDRCRRARSRCGVRRMVSRICRSGSRSRRLAPDRVARARRSSFSASRRLSSTVCMSNTVGFWNLRPMPSSAICGLVELGQVGAAVEQHVALVRPGLAGDDVHHGGLAGAVRADDRAHLAGLDRERQLVERLEAVERDADAVEIEQRGGGACCPCALLRRLRRGVRAGLASPSQRLVAPAARAHQC